MIDILNYTIYGYPVLIYSLMILTAGSLTYATFAAKDPEAFDKAAPAAAPAAPAAPAPAPTQGGRKHRKSKRKTVGVKTKQSRRRS